MLSSSVTPYSIFNLSLALWRSHYHSGRLTQESEAAPLPQLSGISSDITGGDVTQTPPPPPPPPNHLKRDGPYIETAVGYLLSLRATSEKFSVHFRED